MSCFDKIQSILKKKKTETPTVPSPPPILTPQYQVKSAMTTIFWVGEDASADNDHIHNHASAWDEKWNEKAPNENPYYFALPYNDFALNSAKKKASAKLVPWYTPSKFSILKNRWIVINFKGQNCYAQWQDVGPFNEDDFDYVFGSNPNPADPRAGLDVSPAVAKKLGLDGQDDCMWSFIEESDVPPGPWLNVITRSQAPSWGELG